MTLTTALSITSVLAAGLFVVSRGFKPNAARIAVGVLIFGWISEFVLGLHKLSVGCQRMFSECYVDGYDSSLDLDAGSLVIAGWILCLVVFVHQVLKRLTAHRS